MESEQLRALVIVEILASAAPSYITDEIHCREHPVVDVARLGVFAAVAFEVDGPLLYCFFAGRSGDGGARKGSGDQGSEMHVG
jgi:hypothetical protein